MIGRHLVAAFVFGALLTASPVKADAPTVLVLDASGSMWAQLPEGRSRIEVARNVLGDFLATRDATRPLGVVAYGHNRRGDCTDIETVAPIGVPDAPALATRLNRISPRGKTPLTDALRRAAAMIPPAAEEADLVLITDGLETCGGDPCALAAELAASGIRMRAHVVGFGLTEGEVRQMACLPELTGGQLITAASGADLADALGRTAERPATEPAAPGQAALNLTIRASNAGRPDSVRFIATGADGQARDLGLLTFDGSRTALPAELEEGIWLIRATTEGQGEGQAEINVAAGDARTVYVPFIGLYPDVVMDNRGPYEAGVSAAVPYAITNVGLAAGGADYLISILPLTERDRSVASAYERERTTWHYQDGRLGAYVASVSMPSAPGGYLLSFHRHGDDPVSAALVLHEVVVTDSPDVTIDAPSVANPGAVLPITVAGGQNGSDIIEIWQNGTAFDRWNPRHSTYLRDLLAGATLAAPDAPGEYEIVYLRANAADGAASAARLALSVATGDVLAEAPAPDAAPAPDPQAAVDSGPDQGRAWADYPFACLDAPLCEFRDSATGLAFTLPGGWVADQPSLAAMTATGPQTPHAEFLEAKGNLNQLVLNPRQWLADNGPCFTTRAGELCLLRNDSAPGDPAAFEAAALLQLTLTRGETLRRCGTEPCAFQQANPPFSGTMPGLWSVEVAQTSPDGRLSTWFFDQDAGGNFKLLGLNQAGGDDCRSVPQGQLCAFTPYLSTDEMAAFVDGLESAQRATGVQVSPDALREVLDILRGN